jgi:hypothetical protein
MRDTLHEAVKAKGYGVVIYLKHPKAETPAADSTATPAADATPAAAAPKAPKAPKGKK